MDRAKPKSKGTVALHRIIGGGAELLSLLDFIILARALNVSTWFTIISSLSSGHFEAMSDNKVLRQKLNFSADGIPVKMVLHYSQCLAT